MIKIIILMLLPLSVLASNGQDVQEWWDKEYKPNIEPKQIEKQLLKIDNRCPQKIQYYTDLVEKYPEDIFYKWRLKTWKKRCK